MLDFLNGDPKIEQNNDILNNYTTCFYCGIRNSDLLIQCGQCDYKFCNGFSDLIQSSHIIFHMRKSKHTIIKLSKINFNESFYSDDNILEIITCEYCSVSNIFELYFYKDTRNKKIEFLCQFHYEKIKVSKDIKEIKLIESNFKKIVSQDNCKKKSFINPIFVEIPKSLEDIKLLADCDIEDIYKNEDLLESVDPITQRFLNKVKDRYSSDDEYYDIYKPLIFSELNYVKQIYQAKQEYPIELELEKENDELYIIIKNTFKDINLNIGKRVTFSQEPKNIEEILNKIDDKDDDDYKDQSGIPIEFLGLINKIIPGKYSKKIVILPIDKDLSLLRNNLGLYYMRENYCEIPYFRMLKGLDCFVNNHRNNTSNLIHNQILGISSQDNIKELDKLEMKNIFNDKELITKIDNYGELNTQQRKCLRRVFEHSLNMIQGPPGTGKTFLASFIIYNIFHKRKDDQDKILVCAPSNSTTDNLAISLLKIIKSLEKNDKDKDKGSQSNINDSKNSKSNNNKRMKILRVYPKTRELFNIINNNELTEISLHTILEYEIEKIYENIEEEENEEKIEEKELYNLIDFLSDNSIIENNLKNKNAKEDINQYENKYPENYKGRSAKIEEIKIGYKKLKNIIRNIIDEHDIIISTCSTSFDNKLINIDFKYVIIDESTQCNEVECLLPIVHGSSHVVLIGDQKQLGPTVLYPKAKILGMKVSLFERMIKIHPENFLLLKKQYRMNPELSKFSSNFFYDGKIKNSSKHKESKCIKKIFNKFCWPKKDIPIMFININNKTTLKYSLNINNKKNSSQDNYFTFERDIGKSYENELEANITVKVINLINDIKSYKKGKYNIGIITPYIGQKKLILEKLDLKNKDKNFDYYNNNIITVASVDSFQGKEKDFIIINTVKSNYKNYIGFLKDPRRLNVSLTRAKHGLIIIGDAYCLSNSIGENGNRYSVWRYLIKYYQDIGVIVDYNDGEKGEKMFTPTKIFKDEKLEKYNFLEYDYNASDNKPNINRDYIDNYEYTNKRFQNYFDDRKYYIDDEFIDDNDFQYGNYYEDIIEQKNLYSNYGNKFSYKNNFNYDYYSKNNREEISTIDDYYDINDHNINDAYKENAFDDNNNYNYYRHSNVQNNYENYNFNYYDKHLCNYKKDY